MVVNKGKGKEETKQVLVAKDPEIKAENKLCNLFNEDEGDLQVYIRTIHAHDQVVGDSQNTHKQTIMRSTCDC